MNNSNKKVVLVGGCFDFIHYGHVSFLTAARRLGDILVVALESDTNVKKMKGNNRPIHNQTQRQHMLESLKVVDKVILLPEMKSDEDYRDLVVNIKPNIIAVTQGDPLKSKKQAHADTIGATVKVIPKVRTPSTSQLAKLLGLE